MSSSFASLQQERDRVVAEMGTIDRLRRGTLSQHFLRRRRGGKTLTHGPYFVLQRYLRGKKFSQHIPVEQAEKVAGQVANYRRFQELAERFVTLTDQMTQRENAPKSKKTPDAGSRRRALPGVRESQACTAQLLAQRRSLRRTRSPAAPRPRH